MRRPIVFMLAAALSATLVLAVLSGCSKRRSAPAGPDETASYIGSDWCGYCHGSLMTSFETTGHPHVLKAMSGGQQPEYPSVGPGLSGAGDPPNFAWTDVTYVVGGYGWKADFLGSTGYFLTAGGENQFNLRDSSWTDYRQGEQVSYDCAACHTTGYDPEGHQGGLEGISGTWALSGVQCERCHGPGSIHVTDPDRGGMTINRNADFCGQCHSRGSLDLIPARDGFIRNYEQQNELLASPMSEYDCIDCHDPHRRAHWDPDGIHTSCKSCHDDKSVLVPQMSAFQCIECHMPYATKSAVSLAEYQGDVRTHLFRISTDSLAQMFDATGDYAMGYLTIEYSCMHSTCHDGYPKGYLSSVARFVH